ncbi:MAG TPA: lytic transglycosylase domain-containing protein [Mobilitalea sp.]|nr:lytic transglycosylase domain-containing protein [Mobilitalea sp.]
MSEINGVSSVDNKNTYNTNSVKKTDAAADFSSYLGESKSMDDIFQEAADKYNVPVELLKAVGKAESNYNTNAVSRCGAQGVMQLMPATAKELGVTDSFDAEQNIMAGAKYISGLLNKYDGNIKLALAAYNAGSGNVAKYNGVPPFDETQNYVKKVMNYMGQGNIEIADTNTGTGNQTNRLITSATVTPLQRNLSFIPMNDSDTVSSGLGELDSFFSYDDYMKFLDIFLKDKEEEKTEENSTNYNTKDINYSVPVINLIKNQNLY